MTVSKATPTQEEQDAHARGERLSVHEPDGSPEQVIHGWLAPVKKTSQVPEPPPPAPVEPPPPAPEPESPPPVQEEKAAAPETERASYKTRRTRAKDEEA